MPVVSTDTSNSLMTKITIGGKLKGKKCILGASKDVVPRLLIISHRDAVVVNVRSRH